jgi:hypothetical protein
MNGIHDLGGMQCMAPVVREEDEHVVHTVSVRREFVVLV